MVPRTGLTTATVVDDNPTGDRPLTARSILLSTLLGYHPPELSGEALVRIGGLFDLPASTVRITLTRMVADGDVTLHEGRHRLAGHLLDRQRRQAESCSPAVRNARGVWKLAVVTTTARPLPERIALRRAMERWRMAELREGVWLRPDNLRGAPPDAVGAQCTVFATRPEEPTALAARLWDLDGWAARAADLLRDLERGPSDLRAGFLLSTQVVRHLRGDPVLPDDLLPAAWPGARLRRRYAAFEADFASRLRSFGGV